MDSQFKCPSCGMEFTSQVDLDAHTTEAHKEDASMTASYDCPKCGFKAKSQTELDEHTSQMSGDPAHSAEA